MPHRRKHKHAARHHTHAVKPQIATYRTVPAKTQEEPKADAPQAAATPTVSGSAAAS